MKKDSFNKFYCLITIKALTIKSASREESNRLPPRSKNSASMPKARHKTPIWLPMFHDRLLKLFFHLNFPGVKRKTFGRPDFCKKLLNNDRAITWPFNYWIPVPPRAWRSKLRFFLILRNWNFQAQYMDNDNGTRPLLDNYSMESWYAAV